MDLIIKRVLLKGEVMLFLAIRILANLGPPGKALRLISLYF